MSHTLDHLLLAMQQDQQSPEIFSSLLSSWIEHTATELGEVISRHGATDHAQRTLIDKVLERYQSLDDVSRGRFLLSTDVSSYLEEPDGMAFEGEHVGTRSLLQALADALEREHVIACIRTGRDVNTDGDRVDSPLGDVIARRDELGWSLEPRQTIGGVIALDVDSTLSMRYEPDSGTFCRARLEVDDTEHQLIADKLERAMALIDAATPLFGLMIRSFTRRIMVRKSVGLDEPVEHVPLGSEYRPIHTGCIRILNVHRSEMTVVLCAEAILHESTHSFLSAYESIHGKFMSSEIRFRPVSPWSGNYIPNHSLAHAIFVYYALHELFDHALCDATIEDEAILRSLKRRRLDVAVGFCLDQSLSSMFLLDEVVPPRFMQIVDCMQERIRQRYRQKAIPQPERRRAA